MSKPKIALIIGSTRPTRFADIPAQWFAQKVADEGAIDLEVVDLRDYPLPFFDEAASNLWAPSKGEEAQRWQKKIGEFDGYIFVVAEYNRSITGALKNALDHSYVEWNRKPMGILAYGGVGGARAAEHLRLMGIELQMVPLRNAIHIGGADFYKIHPGMGGSGNMAEIEKSLEGSYKAMIEELLWWTAATKAARG